MTQGVFKYPSNQKTSSLFITHQNLRQYLLSNTHLAAAPWMLAPGYYAYALIPAVIHGSAVIQLNRQGQVVAQRCEPSWRAVDQLLGIATQSLPTERRGGLRTRDWYWVAWTVAVTLLLSLALCSWPSTLLQRHRPPVIGRW
jgi:hypothetical protein